jgi:hypothetical protein
MRTDGAGPSPGRSGAQKSPVNAPAVHGWIPGELATWEPPLQGLPWSTLPGVEPEAMNVARPVRHGRREETYSNATRHAPTQLPCSRSLPRLTRGVGVSRRVFTSSLKRCGSSESNPPWAGSSPYSSHRSHSPSGGVRSQGRPGRAAMQWPGGETSGGMTMRPGMGARVLTRLKRWGDGLCGPTSLCGVGDSPQRTCRVRGGVPWRKR